MNINVFKPFFDLLTLPYPGPYMTLLMLSFILGFPIIQLLSRRFDLSTRRTLPLWAIVAFSALVGSKIFHVLFDERLSYYLGMIGEKGIVVFLTTALNPFTGGHVFYGGIAGAFSVGLLVVWRIYREESPTRLRYYDLFVIPTALGLVLSRIGCFFSGCCFGIVSDTFGVVFPPFSTAAMDLYRKGQLDFLIDETPPLIPTQLIESAASLAIFIYLLSQVRKAKHRSPGFLLTRFLFLYAIARFSIEFLRNDTRGAFLFFSTGQWMSLAILAVLGIIWWRKNRRPIGPISLMGPIGHIGLMGLMLTVSSTAWALSPEKKLHHYVAQHWSVKDGLPHNSVEAVIRTADGFVWIATPEGLARFDGKDFTVFNKRTLPSTLSSDRFISLASAPDDTLWAGTEGGDIIRYDPHGMVLQSREKGLPAAPVRRLIASSLGLWTIIGEKLFLLSGKEIVERPGIVTPAGEPLLVTDPRGAVFAVAGTDVSPLTADKNERITFSLLTGKKLTAAIFSPDGALWIGTATGEIIRLSGLSDTTGKVLRPPDGVPISAFAADGGVLWAGSRGTGLIRIHGDTIESFGESSGLRGLVVRTLYRDREGRLWVGTEEGLTLFSDGPAITLTTQDGLSSNLVYALAEAPDGSLWIGTRGGGLNRYLNGKFSRYTKKEGLPSDLIGALSLDDDGTLWIGSSAGITALRNDDIKTFTTRNGLSHDITGAILRDRKKELWVGTINGDLHLLKRKGAFRAHRANRLFPDMTVTQIFEDRSGRLWVAAAFGLSLFNDGYIKTYTQADGLSSRSVLALTEDADMNLWIGTYRGGLNLHREGRFLSFSLKNGLPADDVYAILIDDADRLWLSTNNGIRYLSRTALIRYLTGTGPLPTIGLVGLAEGMKTLECTGGVQPTALRGKNGLFYFSTIKGLTVVDPAKLDLNATERTPQPYIVSLSLDERTPSPVGPRLTIPADTHQITIRVGAISLQDQKDITFAHRLDGVDLDWIETGPERIVTYRDLAPNTYTFNLRAQRPGAKPQTATVSLQMPPRHNIPLLIALLSTGAIGLLLFLYLSRRKRRSRIEKIALTLSPDRKEDPPASTVTPPATAQSIPMTDIPPSIPVDAPPATSPAPEPTDLRRYERTRLDDETAANMLRHITRIMENNKPYKDSDLTLPQLAELVDLSPHLLSQILNDRLNKNFNLFVNEYRIEEVKEMLKNPENRNKLLAIAYDAGFSSKTTFNTIFKKCTGKTPSEYRRSLYGGDIEENEDI